MLKGRKLAKSIISLIICICIIILAYIGTYFFYIKNLKDRYEDKLLTTNKLIEENQKDIYITKDNMKFGDVITENNIIKLKVFSSISEEELISIGDIGKILLIDLAKEVPIYKSMLSEAEIESDIREEEFTSFYLGSNLLENDYIDLRIRYANGEDYIVLSKKAVKDLSLENNLCFLWLNAKEQLIISSAIVDTYLKDGSKLYTSKYIEPNIQKESIVNYLPSKEVIDLINSDPNILDLAKNTISKEIREELDNRLSQFYLTETNIVNESNKAITTSPNDEEEIYFVD